MEAAGSHLRPSSEATRPSGTLGSVPEECESVAVMSLPDETHRLCRTLAYALGTRGPRAGSSQT